MVFEIVESFYLNIYTTLNWIKNSKQTTEEGFRCNAEGSLWIHTAGRIISAA